MKSMLMPIIEAGADVNHTDPKSCTALIEAVGFRSDQCVKYLIEAGADVNQVCHKAHTALLFSTKNGGL